MKPTTLAAWVFALGVFTAASVPADLEIEPTGNVLSLPKEPGAHWFWVADFVRDRASLFDADTGRMLGMVDAGPELRPVYPQHAKARKEIYVPETFYTRGNRGNRVDIVTIYDAVSLQVLGDVEVPAKSADGGMGPHYFALLDDQRFAVLFNQNPGASVSVVNVETRSFAGEIDTAGCALVYPAGPQRFGMLCGDGKAMLLTLNDDGTEKSRTESPKFFDATDTPIVERGARSGNVWHYTDFDGDIHAVDFSGDTPKPLEPWSLVSDAERDAGWRSGGRQPLALHESTGRLFVGMHEGGPGSHKDPSTEIWVYDLETRSRTARFETPNLLVPYMAAQADGSTSAGPPDDSFASSVGRTLVEWIIPSPGIDALVVTQDDDPVIIVGNTEVGSCAVLSAGDGSVLRDVAPTGITGGGISVP